MNNPYTEQVKPGAALLDKECPGWRDKVDLTALDLSDGCYCILGQVFGDFDDGIWALWEVDPSDDDGDAVAWTETDDFQALLCDNGFTIDRPLRSHKWRLLQEAWIAVLGGGA